MNGNAMPFEIVEMRRQAHARIHHAAHIVFAQNFMEAGWRDASRAFAEVDHERLPATRISARTISGANCVPDASSRRCVASKSGLLDADAVRLRSKASKAMETARICERAGMASRPRPRGLPVPSNHSARARRIGVRCA